MNRARVDIACDITERFLHEAVAAANKIGFLQHPKARAEIIGSYLNSASHAYDLLGREEEWEQRRKDREAGRANQD